MTPSGYNHSAGGEYSGARRDKFLGAAHVERLARATVAVACLDGKAHEADARKLVDQGTGKVLEHYRSDDKGRHGRFSDHAGRNDVNAAQASKRVMRKPTRPEYGEGCQRSGSERREHRPVPPG